MFKKYLVRSVASLRSRPASHRGSIARSPVLTRSELRRIVAEMLG